MIWVIIPHAGCRISGRGQPLGFLTIVRHFLWTHPALFNVVAYNVHNNHFMRQYLSSFSDDCHREDSLALRRPYNFSVISSTVRKAKEITQPYDTTVVIVPSRLRGSGITVKLKIEFTRTLSAGCKKSIYQWWTYGLILNRSAIP